MLKTVNICFEFPASYLAGSVLFYCIYSGCSIKQGTERLISSSYFVNKSYNMALAYLSFFFEQTNYLHLFFPRHSFLFVEILLAA